MKLFKKFLKLFKLGPKDDTYEDLPDDDPEKGSEGL